MREFTYVIADENGMHARPAGKLTACAKQFSSEVTVFANGKQANGKRLLSLMGLGAVKGTSLRFCVDGKDEDTACEALDAFCRAHLGGEEAEK